MAAAGKPLKPNEMPRQRRRYVDLRLDRSHRVIFTAHQQCRALDAVKIGQEVEAVPLARPRALEPVQHVLPYDTALDRVRVARRARVVRHRKRPPGGDRRIIRRALRLEEAPPRERPDLRPAETLEQRDPLFRIGVALRLGADQDQFARMRGMRSEEHTSELQSRGLISYAVFCLKKKKQRMDNRASRQHRTDSRSTMR